MYEEVQTTPGVAMEISADGNIVGKIICES
jgi:hypothetical protein